MIRAEIQGRQMIKRYQYNGSRGNVGDIVEILVPGDYVHLADEIYKDGIPRIGDTIKLTEKHYAKVTEVIWTLNNAVVIQTDYNMGTIENETTERSRFHAIDHEKMIRDAIARESEELHAFREMEELRENKRKRWLPFR